MKILIPAILLTAFFAVPAQAFYGNYNDPYYLDYMVGHAGYNNYSYGYYDDYYYRDTRYHYYDEYDHSGTYGYNDYYNSSNYYYYPSTYYPTYSYGYTPSRSNNWSYCDSVLPGSQLDDGKCVWFELSTSAAS